MNVRWSWLVGNAFGALVATFAITNAQAATCALRSSSGTCTLWSNGTAAHLVSDVQGPVNKHPTFQLEVTPIPPFAPNPPVTTASGVIACSNGGSKGTTSPGIQTVFIPDLTVYVPNLLDLTLTQHANITKNSVQGNVAGVDTTDNAILPPATLQELVGACPNANWRVVDFVPCNAEMDVALSNDDGAIDSAVQKCTLDYPATATQPASVCSTLQWQGTASSPKFEKRFYQCTLQ